MDTLARFFLLFSQISTVSLILLVGFCSNKRRLFFHAALLASFDIVVNVALKGTFKIPLPPELHPGYAFPSGHMQFATVFYGWLFLCLSSKKIRSLIPIILSGIGYGLIYFHYHTLVEVIAGVFFAAVILILYLQLLEYLPTQTPWLIGSLSTIILMYCIHIYQQVPAHVWPAYAALVIIIGTERAFSKSSKHHELWSFPQKF